jgi:hypothetical protein
LGNRKNAAPIITIGIIDEPEPPPPVNRDVIELIADEIPLDAV